MIQIRVVAFSVALLIAAYASGKGRTTNANSSQSTTSSPSRNIASEPSCNGESYYQNGQWVCEDPQAAQLFQSEDTNQQQAQSISEKDKLIAYCIDQGSGTQAEIEQCKKEYANVQEHIETSTNEEGCAKQNKVLDPLTQNCVDSLKLGGTNSPSLIEVCRQAQEEVKNDCNPESKSLANDASEITSTLNQVASSMTASACSNLSAISSATQAAVATFSYLCNSSYNNCKKSCMGMDTTICDTYGQKGKEAQAKATQAVQQIATSIRQCQAAFGGDGNPCALPQNAGTIACKGVQAVPGSNPMAVAGTGLQNNNSTGLYHEGVGSSSGGAVTGGDGYDYEEGNAPVALAAAQAAKMGESIGGAKGGGSVSGGGSGGGAATGASGSDGESQSLGARILSGFFGGGGGSSGGRQGGGWRNLFGLGSGETKTVQKTPDLKHFMPGGKFDPNKHRGIAGQYIGKDGILGPHANIWKHITNRYQYKRLTLLP